MTEFFGDDQDQKPWSGQRPKLVATYTYRDEQGRPLHRKHRYEPKSFSQERWDEKEQRWVAGLGPYPQYRRVLYRLPELLADPGAMVLVVEGEGKADLLASWKLTATCSPDGSSRWLDDYSRLCLAGRDCVVLPDNDEPGLRYADQVVGSLLRHDAASIRLVLLPSLPVHGDVKDWHQAGGTPLEFLQLVHKMPCWTHST